LPVGWRAAGSNRGGGGFAGSFAVSARTAKVAAIVPKVSIATRSRFTRHAPRVARASLVWSGARARLPRKPDQFFAGFGRCPHWDCKQNPPGGVIENDVAPFRIDASHPPRSGCGAHGLSVKLDGVGVVTVHVLDNIGLGIDKTPGEAEGRLERDRRYVRSRRCNERLRPRAAKRRSRGSRHRRKPLDGGREISASPLLPHPSRRDPKP